MNYRKHYWALMSQARGKSRAKTSAAGSAYYEQHHAIPVSLGGEDGWNEVLLTAREHFVAHWLLTKFTTGKARHSMLHALRAIAMSNSGRRLTSRQYAVCKEATRMLMLELSAAGLHPWQDTEHCARSSVRMAETQLARSASGTHAWQTDEYKEDRRAAMTAMNTTNNPAKKPENRAASAARMRQEFVCEHCGDTVHGSTNYKTHHSDNCKFKTHAILATRLSDNARFVFDSFSSAYDATQAAKLAEVLRGARDVSGGYAFKYIAKETAASQLLLSGICVVTEAVKAPAYTACPHCSIVGSHNASGIAQFHFDNCASQRLCLRRCFHSETRS